jgi:hypothetical protein
MSAPFMKTAPSGVGFSIVSSCSELPQEKSPNPQHEKRLLPLGKK